MIFFVKNAEFTLWKSRKFTHISKHFREINLQYNSLFSSVKKYFDGIFAKKSLGKSFEITTLWNYTLACHVVLMFRSSNTTCWQFFIAIFHLISSYSKL